MRLAACCLALWLLPGAMAQDERRVSSPNGNTEFRISVIGSQDETTFSRIAYEVYFKGRQIVGRSFMGLDIYEQEPILGENVGLIGAVPGTAAKYHSLLLHYMQNGSTGRRISVEVRAYDDGVAFRYVIPPSAMLDAPVIDEELTEFRIAGLNGEGALRLPLRVEQPGGVIEIAEQHKDKWPPLFIRMREGHTWISSLARSHDRPEEVFSGRAPVICPWRVIAIGSPAAMLSELP